MLRRSLWQLRGRLFGGGVILGYHRVAVEPNDAWDLCVPTDVFQSQMEVLRRDYRPVTLSALSDEEVGRPDERGRLPVAVTFDDGYEDVLRQALPVLERYEVPATVFVVIEGMEGVFWWDRLQRVLEADERLPASLDLNVASMHLRWSRPDGLQKLGEDLYEALRCLGAGDREELLAMLESCIVGGDETLQAPPPVLTEEQLQNLDQHSLVEIGSHSATHPELAGLTADELRREIFGSRERLGALLGKPVESFSYPHGVLNPSVREQVIGAGYRRACASWNGLVGSGVDVFRLPRLWPGGQRAEHFRRWLHGWTGR